MPVKTFDPISGPTAQMPAQEPGKVVVASHEGDWREIKPTRIMFRDRLQEALTPRIIAAVLILTLIFLYILGFFGFMLALIVGLGLVGFAVTNRTNVISEFFLGIAPVYYVVDARVQTIQDFRRVQLRDTGIFATIDIEYSARIANPVAAARQGIRDVREHLSRAFYVDIESYAKQGTLTDKIEKLREQLHTYKGPRIEDATITILNPTFDVQVDGEAAAALKALSEAELRKQGLQVRQQLETIERDYQKSIISDEEALRAEMLREGADKAEVLRMKLASEQMTFQRRLDLLKFAEGNGWIEEHEVRRDYPEFYEEIKKAMGGMLTLPKSDNLTIGNTSKRRLPKTDASKNSTGSPTEENTG